RVPGRVSASLLTTIGLSDLVAQTPDQYVDIAVRLVHDLGRLTHERRTLRDRLLTSPIADAGRYTRAVEDVYRDLSRGWCDRPAHAEGVHACPWRTSPPCSTRGSPPTRPVAWTWPRPATGARFPPSRISRTPSTCSASRRCRAARPRRPASWSSAPST